VADAAVVSIPHELYGEDIVAVLKLERALSWNRFSTRSWSTLAGTGGASATGALLAIDEFPRTANGKVQKSQLRELVVGKLQIGSGSFLRARQAT